MTVTRKLLLINSLICAAFIVMIMVVFFSFRHVEKALTTRFASETRRIIENAHTTRELSRILSGMNLVLRTFHEQSEIIETEGEKLFAGIASLLSKTGDPGMEASLRRFSRHLTDILSLCEQVNLARSELRAAETAFDNRLISLDDIIAQRLLETIVEGGNTSDLEQLSSMIGGWREAFIRMKLLFVGLGVEHFKLPMGDTPHPLMTRADNLQLRLRTLTASPPDIASHGIDLIRDLNRYKVSLLTVHQSHGALGKMLEENHREREKLLSMMEQSDALTARQTEEAVVALTTHINRSMAGNVIIFLAVLPIVILGGMTAFSIKKPIATVIEYTRRLSRGDIPEPIEETYSGEFALVGNYLNMLISATHSVTRFAEDIAVGNLETHVLERSGNDRLMQALNRMLTRLDGIIRETRGMIQNVGEGQMDVRGNAEAFEGGWRELVEGVNDLIAGLSSAVSRSAALALEMKLARNIQTGLLPAPASVSGVHPEFDISATMIPADQVGGDFYDIRTDSAGNLRLAVGDVSGHGVTPGLIMMMAQTVHATVCARTDSDARGAVARVNEILYANVHERLKETHFMTFNALKYLGHGRFEHAGAHLRLIVLRKKTGECELIDTRGVYLNLKKDITKATRNAYFNLEDGDILVLYTDGLTEARNPDGELLDIQGLQRLIVRHAKEDPDPGPMGERIMADVFKWCENRRDDDMTLVVVKKKTSPVESTGKPAGSRRVSGGTDPAPTPLDTARLPAVFGNFQEACDTRNPDVSSTLRLRARSISPKRLWASKDRSAEFMGDIWALFVDAEKAERIKTVLHSVCVELIENAVKYGCREVDCMITVELCLNSDELLAYVTNRTVHAGTGALARSAREILAAEDPRRLFKRKMKAAKRAKEMGESRSQLGYVRIVMQNVELAWKIEPSRDFDVVTTLARIPLNP